jgi:hypothetical protein
MEMKRSLVFTFAILLLITSGALVSAITGSMGNAKMILYPDVNGWTNTVLEKTILVKNVNDVPINVTLIPDANATKFVEIIDKSFILQPGEEKKAQFDVKVRKVGTYNGQINVFFRPANGTEGGVVLSSNIIVIARKNQGYTDNNTDTPVKNNTNNNTTGDNGSNNGSDIEKPNLLLIWGVGFVVLLLVLLLLLYIWNKKRGRSKKRKNKFK